MTKYQRFQLHEAVRQLQSIKFSIKYLEDNLALRLGWCGQQSELTAELRERIWHQQSILREIVKSEQQKVNNCKANYNTYGSAYRYERPMQTVEMALDTLTIFGSKETIMTSIDEAIRYIEKAVFDAKYA